MIRLILAGAPLAEIVGSIGRATAVETDPMLASQGPSEPRELAAGQCCLRRRSDGGCW